MAVDAQRVEPEIDGRLEVAADALGRGVGGQLGDREVVGALEEEAFTVDGAPPVVPGDLAQPGAPIAAVAHLAVDQHLHVDVDERLLRRASTATTAAGR